VLKRRRQREDDVEVGHGQQLGFPLLHPLSRRGALALGAMPVAAAVVGDGRVGALLAARNVPASWRSHASHGRAAVRQLSMALITFIWARLTWPRLASRQAAPWPRKMSATSRAGRATAQLLRRVTPPRTDRPEPIQGAGDLAQHLSCHVRVA